MKALRSAARFLWALPASVVGVTLGVASLAEPRYDEGTVVFEGTKGYLWALRKVGFTAQTWGQVILAYGKLDPILRAHEREHVRQWTIWGPLFAIAYHAEGLRELVLRRGYYGGNYFERRARAVEEGFAAGALYSAPSNPTEKSASRS
jgi:hypothetical protein